MDRFKEISNREHPIARLIPYSIAHKHDDYRWLLNERLMDEFKDFQIFSEKNSPDSYGLQITFIVRDNGNVYSSPVLENLQDLMPTDFIIMANTAIEQVKSKMNVNK